MCDESSGVQAVYPQGSRYVNKDRKDINNSRESSLYWCVESEG